MRRVGLAGLILLSAAGWACGGRREGAKRPVIRPTGNGLWFADGFASEQKEGSELASLAEGGFSWILVPAAKLEVSGGRWTVVRATLPPRPIGKASVSVVIEAGREAATVLESHDKAARKAFEDALGLAAATAADEVRFGFVSGVHLDFPVTAASAPATAAAIRAIRSRLPAGIFLSMTMSDPIPAEGAEKFTDLGAAVDGFVAMVFGRDRDRADPIEVDRLGKPWWAGYSPNAEGLWKGRSGTEKGKLTEGFLSRLSDDPRLRFQHDMEVEERVGFGYDFRVRRPLVLEGRTFETGDEIIFRQPFLADFVRRLGHDTAGRPNAAGRLIRLAGASESDRIFTLPALNDILLGRPLTPALRVSLSRTGSDVVLGLENTSAMPSAISRTSNWIEVDLGRPGVRDVRNAGFDRYEVFSPAGARVSLGRSSRVRFYETLIGPHEKIDPATILLRPPIPASCCRFRYHVLAANGQEIATDWQTQGR